ncbi:unnamed protein product [Periconia digitata]|uniref:Uncharacterized protein n=1 Tax=Periconia digitata TaxID=1303443 RepID=A0A9W4UKE7_9PLEO|nr:unnamed protein product [Periconia digitata]
MRFSTVVLALVGAVAALDPAPTAGSACTCGQAPEIVYSKCFMNADGTNSIWLCMGSCTWLLAASPVQCGV